MGSVSRPIRLHKSAAGCGFIGYGISYKRGIRMVLTISVKVTGGMYFDRRRKVERTLEISETETLERLTAVILSSLEFDFDHLYEYAIHGTVYEGAPYGSADERCRVKLNSLGLKKGDMFELHYDFGDDWMFLLSVLDVKREKGGPARIIASRGEVEQYPDWDEDDDPDFDGSFGEDWDPGEEDWDPDDADWDWDMDEEDEAEPVRWTRLATDALLDAAFRYKKTKLWKRLSEKQVFAVRLSDGETGYVSILGDLGEHCAVCMYRKDGFESYRRMAFGYRMGDLSDFFELAEFQNRQDCIQLILDSKDYLRDEEIETVQKYCTKNDIRLRGANAYPHVWRFRPGRMPWQPSSAGELECLKDAVEAAVFLAGQLDSRKKAGQSIREIEPWTKEVPLLKRVNGSFEFSGTAALPEPEGDKPWPVPEVLNEVSLARLKKHKKKGTLECRLIQFPEPVLDDDPEDAPYFPTGLFAEDAEKEFLFAPKLVRNWEENPGEIVNFLIDQLRETKFRPAVIRVRDERTKALIAPLAESIGAKIEETEELPALSAALEQMFSDFGDDEYNSGGREEVLAMLEEIEEAPPEMISQMPKELKTQIVELLDMGIIPEKLAEQLRKKLGH